ncbi:MAG: LysR family transcriptional regulator [Rhodospirillales bacterium]|nr:LysR family transcriptional regulator [Rhodospirillales bacterium]
MARINIMDLSIFLAIARARSFRKAAVELGVTPSALSHALRALEERIDVRLFNRTTRAVSLTEAGTRLLARIQPAYRDIDDALHELAGYRDAPAGLLRINAAHAGARLALMPVIPPFLRTYPGIKVEIFAQNATVDMVNEGFDAGLRLGERVAADMISVRLGPRQRFVAVMAPALIESHGTPQTPRDLARMPCIRHRFDSGEEYLWEFEKDGAELSLSVTGPFTTNSQDLMILAAQEAVGVAFVFEGLVEEALAAGRLVRVLEDWCPSFSGLHVYYPGRRQVPPPLRAFIDFVRGSNAPADTAHPGGA